jgi:hypothetical protein
VNTDDVADDHNRAENGQILDHGALSCVKICPAIRNSRPEQEKIVAQDMAGAFLRSSSTDQTTRAKRIPRETNLYESAQDAIDTDPNPKTPIPETGMMEDQSISISI